MSDAAVIHWKEKGVERSAAWRSESGVAPPKRVIVADDRLTADRAYQLACEGTALLWRGDFHNARQLLQAMARRADRSRKPAGEKPASASPAEAFHLHRMAQAQRARMLGMLLLPFEVGHTLPLHRAPDVRAACEEGYGAATERYVASLRELLGLIGAHEWRRKGVEIPALGARIHPHYGVWSPVRGEYVQLVAGAPLPRALSQTAIAFDIGTGTGVLAAVLTRRGIARIVATDHDPRALACARDNVQRLGIAALVDVVQADLFPDEPARAALAVCNPPWLPGKPSSPLEHSIYDPESRMLRGYLNGLSAHIVPGGEGWLILSDFAEHLGLRTREQLLAWIEQAKLSVVDKMDVKPQHRKSMDRNDPLHAARMKETTSLWRLAATAATKSL